MFNKKIVILIGIILAIGMLSGCTEDDGGDENGGETPTTTQYALTNFRIGDEVYEDFKNLYVTFSEIKIHEKGEDNDTWINIPLNTTTIDLIELHNADLTGLISTYNIEVGNYTMLRIVVDNASGVLNSTDETVYLDVASGEIKINHLFKLDEGKNNITLTIDLSNSIIKFGGGEKYKILPVISSISHEYQNHYRIRERNGSEIKQMTGNHKPAIDILVNGVRRKQITIDNNESITFDASGSYDYENDTLTYLWDFGDETNTSNLSSVAHVFTGENNETFTVTLTVDDGTDTVTDTVRVKIRTSGNAGNGGNGNGGS